MEWFIGAISFVAGGIIGAAVVYSWKVKDKLIVQAKDLQDMVEAKAKELIEKGKAVIT